MTRVKIKLTLQQTLKARGGDWGWEQSYSPTLSLTSALDGCWLVNTTPLRFTAGDETRCPLYRRLGGPQGRSGQERKFLAPTRIRSPDRSSRSELLYGLRHSGSIPVTFFLCLAKYPLFETAHRNTVYFGTYTKDGQGSFF